MARPKNTITWNDLFTQGTLIDFSVHLWRARLQLKAKDLGIDETEDVQKAFSFGCHRLAPAESFESINEAVRGWQRDIEEHSLAFPLLQGVRYVPDNQVRILQNKLDLRVRDFNIAVEEFLAQYDSMMNEMLPVLEQALHEAAKTPDAAKTAFSRVCQEYPSRQDVAAKFGLEWNFFTIALPTSDIAAQTAKSAIPQVQKVITSMVEELRKGLSEKVSNLLSLARKAQNGTSRSKDGFGNKTKQSMLDAIEKVMRLNVLGDPVLTEQTKMLRRLLESDGDELATVVQNLNKIKVNLESDVAEAAKAVERKLTGTGNRKIAI